jgi:hypothetical protein
MGVFEKKRKYENYSRLFSSIMTEVQTTSVTFNAIHKKFMVLYHLSDMRRVWKKVRSEFKKEFRVELPKRFKKYPKLWIMLNNWIDERLEKFESSGGKNIQYLNKADLKHHGWDEKIILLLYPKPDKVIYLGRGRYAYYYNGTLVNELEDGDEFIEYIANKLERKRKREEARARKDNPNSHRFGTEFIR